MKKTFLPLLALSGIIFCNSIAFAAESININGSTTVLPIMQKLVEAYSKDHPEVSISISAGGSGNGIKALLDGNTDIAMSSRELKESEEKEANQKNIKPIIEAIAVDVILPIVHPTNPVKNLSKDQLVAIFTGKITNWKEVGGNDKRIVVVSRDTSSGTFEAWSELILNKEKTTPSALMQASSGAVLQTVAKNKNAIGYDSYGYLNNSVKAVAVDSIPGNPETAANKTYPVSRKLWILSSKPQKQEIVKFIEFILSPDGQKIVAESGAVPVK